MWNLSKGKLFLPTISTKQLQKMYDDEQNSKAKLRLLAAIHRKKGESIDEIAYLLSKPRKTIHGWILRFQERGISAKDSIKQSGRPVELTVKQREKLIKILERGPPHNPDGLWSTKEIREIITKKFGRDYVKQHVWRILVSLGFSIQRPRKRHYNRASDEEIVLFKKKLDEKQNIIEQKDLSWAHKMKQHLV